MTARSLDIIMALGAALALLLGGFAGFAAECDEIPSEVLRLHIPANSDSPRDQEIKLALRDCVLQEYGTQLSGARSREEAADTVRGLLPEIEKTCCEFLSQQGVDYGAEAELTEMYFPTRRYEQATLPAGEYQALRITLGSGEGHNWWCCLYPGLCFTDAVHVEADKKDMQELRTLVDEDAYEMVTCTSDFRIKWFFFGGYEGDR